MMVGGEREREERREPEEAQRVVDAAVLRHVLPADEQDEQHDERRPHAKEIVQTLGKRQPHEADVEPREPAGGNKPRRDKEQADELVATAGRSGCLLSRRQPRGFFPAASGLLRGSFLRQGITS